MNKTYRKISRIQSSTTVELHGTDHGATGRTDRTGARHHRVRRLHGCRACAGFVVGLDAKEATTASLIIVGIVALGGMVARFHSWKLSRKRPTRCQCPPNINIGFEDTPNVHNQGKGVCWNSPSLVTWKQFRSSNLY